MRSNRVQVRLSSAAEVALRMLATRHGLSASSQAGLLLHQALTRTIESADVQREIGAANTARTNAQWKEDMSVAAELNNAKASQATKAADIEAAQRGRTGATNPVHMEEETEGQRWQQNSRPT